jgi:hypothetical protein
MESAVCQSQGSRLPASLSVSVLMFETPKASYIYTVDAEWQGTARLWFRRKNWSEKFSIHIEASASVLCESKRVPEKVMWMLHGTMWKVCMVRGACVKGVHGTWYLCERCAWYVVPIWMEWKCMAPERMVWMVHGTRGNVVNGTWYQYEWCESTWYQCERCACYLVPVWMMWERNVSRVRSAQRMHNNFVLLWPVVGCVVRLVVNWVSESRDLSSPKIFLLEINGPEKLLKLRFSIKTSHSGLNFWNRRVLFACCVLQCVMLDVDVKRQVAWVGI